MKRDSSDLLDFLGKFFEVISQLVIELYVGIKNRRLPWPACAIAAIVMACFILFRVDIRLWQWLMLYRFYPQRTIPHTIYVTFLCLNGFWIWGLYRVYAKRLLSLRLSEVFTDAGLKTKTGRLPKFISDFGVDDQTRKLLLNPVGLPWAEFERAKPYLEAGLQIFIDEITSNRSYGTLQILYSHKEIPRTAKMPEVSSIRRLEFILGNTRTGLLTSSLREVPHLLIAGFTNAGKSTFLRQFITSLYLNDSKIEFELIDLKRGLEFQLFENLPRIKVNDTVKDAIRSLFDAQTELGQRLELLKANRCENLDAFQAIPEDKRNYDCAWPKGRMLHRKVIVIDEAAEIFLAGAMIGGKEVQATRRLASQIAALGRAAGIHLVIATQRPDRNAVDPLTKTNLQGRICFQMADNASSMTILDCGRATDLPTIRGRAIWKNGMDLVEVQTPLMTKEEVDTLLTPLRCSLEKPPKVETSLTKIPNQTDKTGEPLTNAMPN